MLKPKDDYLDKILEGKRVVLTGPSRCVMQNPPGYVDSYDIVVRINHQWPIPEEKQANFGTRMDLLYHCCSGVDPVRNIFSDDFAPLWVGYGDGKLTESHILKAYLDEKGIHYERMNPFHDKIKGILNSPPQTGFYALLHLLEHDIKELYVTGITFMFEPYMEGYPETRFGNDKMIWTRKTRHHDCQIQFEYFCKHVYGKDDRVVVDDALKEIIEQHDVGSE